MTVLFGHSAHSLSGKGIEFEEQYLMHHWAFAFITFLVESPLRTCINFISLWKPALANAETLTIQSETSRTSDRLYSPLHCAYVMPDAAHVLASTAAGAWTSFGTIVGATILSIGTPALGRKLSHQCVHDRLPLRIKFSEHSRASV